MQEPNFEENKEDTEMSMEAFNNYVNSKLRRSKGVEENWVWQSMTNQIKKIMSHIFTAVQNRLVSKLGYFQLFGLDFLIDDDMRVYLIEVNRTPGLGIDCKPGADVIPGLVDESVRLVVECFEKAKAGKALLPLQSLKGFEIIFPNKRICDRHAEVDKKQSPNDNSHSRGTCLIL